LASPWSVIPRRIDQEPKCTIAAEYSAGRGVLPRIQLVQSPAVSKSPLRIKSSQATGVEVLVGVGVGVAVGVLVGVAVGVLVGVLVVVGVAVGVGVGVLVGVQVAVGVAV